MAAAAPTAARLRQLGLEVGAFGFLSAARAEVAESNRSIGSGSSSRSNQSANAAET